MKYSPKRDLSDWIQLCFKCHRKFDSGENWGKATKIFKTTLSKAGNFRYTERRS